MPYIQNLSLTPRHWYIALVSSMEQLIGSALSTIVGIIIPLLNLFLNPELSSAVQGVMGAMGLTGIAVGSAILGPLADRYGYLALFRICPCLIVAGSVVTSLAPLPWLMCVGLFVAGFGVGGGYSLDSSYISELMPGRWRNVMVGIAKATSAIGFMLPAMLAVLILNYFPTPQVWRGIVWIMGALGLLTLLMRIRWAQSPVWLMARGYAARAEEAAHFFFGKDCQVQNTAPTPSAAAGKHALSALFKGKNLVRVVYSGIPWACEGLGVYGIGVFLPVLIMALGLDRTHAVGIPGIINSVELTAVINFCILPGFVLGLLIVRRLSHSLMLWVGFVGSAAGMAVLLLAYLLHWPVWVSITAFVVFEVLLNAGPHLVTYIIPAAIYPVELRGTGSGVADFLGKVGAILGVFFMPLMLHSGGMTLVLIVTIAVMLAGAAVTLVCARILRN